MTSINSVVNHNKKPLTKVKFNYSQTQNPKYSQDSIKDYLQTIGRVPLLGGEAGATHLN